MTKPTIAILLAGAMAAGACTTADDSTLASAGTGAAIGAAAGAGAGVLISGLTPIEGALIGGAAGGLAGAIWADRDRDGYADGYYYNGDYYEGRPPAEAYQPAPPVYRAAARRGERG